MKIVLSVKILLKKAAKLFASNILYITFTSL